MSDRSEMKLKVNRSLAWIGLASGLVSLLDIVALMILARFWISPQEYGVAVTAIALFPILDLATDMGLSSAVIQKEGNTEEIISTVFWMNLAMSFVLFGVLAVFAPMLGRSLGWPVVGHMLIAYGSKLILQNAYFIPAAIMKRELRFKEFSIIRICANCAEFVAKVGFAWALPPEHVIWCFVLGPLCRSLVSCVGLQLRQPWRPRFVLRLRQGAEYAAFGLKTSGSQILFYFYTNVDYYVVSYFFGMTALGLYRMAYELVLEPVRVISYVVVDLAFPVFARLRGKRAALIEQLVAFTRQNLVVVIPFLVLVVLLAEELLALFFGPEWTPAGTAARILVLVGILRSLSYLFPPLLDGIGYPGVTLVYTVIASVVLPAAFIGFAAWLGERTGYLSVAIAWAVGYPLAFVILVWLALRLVGLRTLAYLRRVAGIPACALVALGLGALVRWAAGGAPTPVRFVLVVVTTIGVLAVLLAYLQGISPRTIARALSARGAPTPPDGPADLPPA